MGLEPSGAHDGCDCEACKGMRKAMAEKPKPVDLEQLTQGVREAANPMLNDREFLILAGRLVKQMGPLVAELRELREAKESPSTIPCCKCGGMVVEFSVPNEAWNIIVRKGGSETDQEYLCLDCFARCAASELRTAREKIDRLREAGECHDWGCGCGHYNGANLATCAMCGRTPGDLIDAQIAARKAAERAANDEG